MINRVVSQYSCISLLFFYCFYKSPSQCDEDEGDSDVVEVYTDTETQADVRDTINEEMVFGLPHNSELSASNNVH